MQNRFRDFIYRCYEVLLGRLPDSGGLMSHSQRLERGTSHLEVVLGIMGSEEFARRPFGWSERLHAIHSLLGDEFIKNKLYPNIVEVLATGRHVFSKLSEYGNIKPMRTAVTGATVARFTSFKDGIGIFFELTKSGRTVHDLQELNSSLEFRLGSKRLVASQSMGRFLVNIDQPWTTISVHSSSSGQQLTKILRSSLQVRSLPNARSISISGRFDPSTGIGLHASAFLHHLDGNYNVSFIDARPEDSRWDKAPASLKSQVTTLAECENVDIAIYTDVFANHYNDNNHLKLPKAAIKIAYVVFDSTRLPGWWVDRINEHFDAVATPSAWGKKMIESSGVAIPVFHLPLSIDLKRFTESPANTAENRKFRFGCIASYSKRKNILQLVRCFNTCFQGRDDVELVVHTPLDFGGGYREVADYVEQNGAENITLSQLALDDSKYLSLMNSFDVFALISKGECYSITPRQAMALGKPAIISAGHAHDELIESGKFISIPVAGYEPALYEAFDGQYIGLQTTYDDRDVCAALNEAYFNYIKHAQGEKERREFSQKFDHSALEEFYRTIVSPKNIFLSDEDVLYKDRICTSSRALFKKYQTLAKAEKQLNSYQHGNQKIIIPAHDGGFFSVFNTFLSHFAWNWGRTDVAAIIPDWRISTISEYRKIEKPMSFCYGTHTDGNIFTKLFYPLSDVPVNEADYSNEDFLRKDVIFYDDFNERNEPNLTYIHAYKLYKQKDFSDWRRWYHGFYKKHFKLRDTIQTEIDSFSDVHFNGQFVIGVHIKHPSHSIEQHDGLMPGVSEFARKILDYVSKNRLVDYKIFVATDQEAVIDYMKAIFGERLIARNGVTRTTSTDDQRYKSLAQSEQLREGHQIQNLIAADPSKWSLNMAKEVIVDAHLLARCNAFIHVTSNVATAVSFINPAVEMIYCE